MHSLSVMGYYPRMMNYYVFFEDLQNKKSVSNNHNCSDDTTISGYFCPNTVFNLSRWVLSEDEIKVLEKELDFALIQNKVNEPELRKD